MNNHQFPLLSALYKRMDQAYDRVAGQYGFQCRGCMDNCCRSLFFHHTHIEKAYLLSGFNLLEQEQKKEVCKKAAVYVDKTFSTGTEPKSLKLICPLNKDGLCILYPYRPMICRLHGLPHELNRPGAPPLKGPGCDAGEFGQTDYIPFDRTPFYVEMARIEKAFRKSEHKNGKIRETIAQMLI